MEGTKINIQVVEENRGSMIDFGKIYGKRVFMPTKAPLIIDFNKKSDEVSHNNGLFVNRNINRYKVEAVDIAGIELEKGIDGTPEIVLNKGKVNEAGDSIEIRCSLDDPKFTRDVTAENVAKALAKDSSYNLRSFFSSGKKLAEMLNQENVKELTRINNLIEDLKKMAGSLESTIEKNTAYAESYYHQLDGKETAVRIHVNNNED